MVIRMDKRLALVNALLDFFFSDLKAVCRVITQVIRQHMICPAPNIGSAVAFNVFESIFGFALVMEDGAFCGQPAARLRVAFVQSQA